MKLGSLELGRVFLAPLSGVADSPFRRICRRLGADAVFSEMASSEGIWRGHERTWDLLRFHEEERPIGIQIFGRDPVRMADSAAAIEEELAPDLIDINLACPARKIVARGAGCALMREPQLACEIAALVVRSVRVPVTAKMRVGWDDESLNALDLARDLQAVGIAAVSIHGRTWKEGFSGQASWRRIADVGKAVGIPVVLSGDVRAPADAERAFAETGCDALMVGRGAYGRPWLFRAIQDHLAGREPQEPSPREMVDTILEHLDLGIAELGERFATVRFRKHLLWYTKGLRNVVALRQSMSTILCRDDVSRLLESVFPGA